MSQPDAKQNVFDPFAMMKQMRDASLENWAKMMTDLVQTEAYAKANGEFLDAWLAASAPFRDSIQSAMTQSLGNLNLPSREEVTRLAERLTHIEMRLDDMDAKLDASLASPKKSPGTGAKK